MKRIFYAELVILDCDTGNATHTFYALHADGNDFVATNLRSDLPDIYNSLDYRMDLKATALPPSTALDHSFTSTWLSVYTRANKTTNDPGFVQVGLLAQKDGLILVCFWLCRCPVFTRGSVLVRKVVLTQGCRGAVGDLVGLNQWHRVELVKYTWLSYWIARVYTAYGGSVDVARYP